MRTVIFQDHGQDFLEWDIDSRGIVIGCRPFQESIWNGVRVLNRHIRVGEQLRIDCGNRIKRTVKYPLEKVVCHGRSRTAAAKQKGGS